MANYILLKLLILAQNYEGWLPSGEHDYLMEIARQTDASFLGKGHSDFINNMNLQQYCKDHGGFDLIYYSQCATENPGDFKHIKDVPCPKVAYMHNGHNYMQQQIDRIHNWGTSLVLFRSWASHFYDYADKLSCPLKFHPQAVNPDLFKDYGLPKDYDVNFTGLVTPHYQLRCKMQQRLNILKNNGLQVAMSMHPGYGNNWQKEYGNLKAQGAVWREDYARLMNRCKLTLTDGGAHNVLVRRYLEAMATKSLLLAPSPYMYEKYGLEPYKHFVPVGGGNWEHEMNYYLEHYDQFRENIVEHAYEWVHKYHTTPIRVRQLLEIFEKVLEFTKCPSRLKTTATSSISATT